MHWQVQHEQTLEDFLKRQFHGASKAAMRSWIRLGLVRVNAQVVKRLDKRLTAGDWIERLEKILEPIEGVQLVYQDEHLLILDKPAGLLSVDTDQGGKRNLFSILKRRYGSERVRVVHRLDRETSGLIAFALSEEGERALKEQLQHHQMQRRYMAVVSGQPQPEEGAWELWIEEQKDLAMRLVQPGEGEHALTFYRTLERQLHLAEVPDHFPPYNCLLELELATGKKHQIRVSCAQAGCPLVGDARYGGRPSSRLGLHAYAISLFHPETGQSMEWISPTVDAFEAWWKGLSKPKREPQTRGNRNKSGPNEGRLRSKGDARSS